MISAAKAATIAFGERQQKAGRAVV